MLTGGILTGQSLIRAAELRAVTTEFQQYQTAVNTFKQKYFALPGDMPNATQFWGRADTGAFSGQCANPATNTGSAPRTCNGNGDGIIGEPVLASYTQLYEIFRVWQHLANAGLINGQFTGRSGSGGNWHHILPQNTPNSKVGSNVGYSYFYNVYSGSSYFPSVLNKHVLTLGGQDTTYEPYHPFLNPEETWNIDKKIDDGKPGTGIVTTKNHISPVCITTSDPATSQYLLTSKEMGCQIIFIFE